MTSPETNLDSPDRWELTDQESWEPSAIGAQRRLQALAACSWSPEAIQNETGLPAFLVDVVTSGKGDTNPDLVRTIASVYDRLWNRDPPSATPDERWAAEVARSNALNQGWVPPLAWDDDQIDLADGRPAEKWKPSQRKTRRAVDLVEDAEFVRLHGGYRCAPIGQIAMRLGVSRDCLEQAEIRARRYGARGAAIEGEAEAI